MGRTILGALEVVDPFRIIGSGFRSQRWKNLGTSTGHDYFRPECEHTIIVTLWQITVTSAWHICCLILRRLRQA